MFMAENVMQEENIKHVASKRFIDPETKKPMEWEIKCIDSQRDEELRKACTKRLEVTGKKGQYTKKWTGISTQGCFLLNVQYSLTYMMQSFKTLTK